MTGSPGDLFPAAAGDQPPVVLDFAVMWCGRHLEPFRAQWPLGAAVAMMRLFHVAAAMPAVQDAAKRDVANLQAALERFRPICCFVERDALEAIYDETVPGRSGLSGCMARSSAISSW